MQFGKYRLVRKLAAGGMAEIYLARQHGVEGFQKRVVVKRILPIHADNDELIQMFLDEARIAASLTHPNIVQIFELGQQGQDYFIAMEYVHGQDLRHICERGLAVGNFLPLRHACRIIADCAAGLHYAHFKTDNQNNPLNIVHRDISPQNLLVSFEGNAKVLDFGIAKAENKVTTTRTGTVKGKFAYMSPEQCNGFPVDLRSDIFALGTILYEITVCRRLFKGDTDVQTIQRVSDAIVTPPTEVQANYPRDLEAIVLKALRKNPAERFQTAQEMQSALEDFLTDNRMKTGPIQIGEYMRDIFPDKLEVPPDDPEIAADEAPEPATTMGPPPSAPPEAAPAQMFSTPPADIGPSLAELAAPAPAPAPAPTPAATPRYAPPGARPAPAPAPTPAAAATPAAAPSGEAVSFVANPNAPYEVAPAKDFKKKKQTARKVSRSSVKRAEHNLRSEEEGEAEVYEKGSRIYYAFLGVAVFIMLCIAGYFTISRGNLCAGSDLLSNTETKAALPDADLGPPPPPLKTVLGEINSEPSGARVVVNGILVNGQTPDHFPVVPGSINTISLYLDGYKPLHRNVEVPADGTPPPVTMALEQLIVPPPPKDKDKDKDKDKARARRRADDPPEPDPTVWPTGKLTIASVPDGADVFVDGKKVGVTPITVDSLAANIEHHITLRRSGYLDHVATRYAYANEEIKLPTFQLTPEDRDMATHFVEFRLEATPRDAQIFLNDQLESASQIFRNVDRNQTLRVEVKIKDYHPYRRIFATTIGSFSLSPELEKIRRDPGQLTLAVKPKETQIFVGSEQHEEVKKLDLPSGKYTVVLVNPDGTRGEVEIEVEANVLAEYTIDFTGANPRMKRVQ